MNRHDGTFTGVFLLVLSGLADTVVGLAMRPVLKTCVPVRSLGYLILRAAGLLLASALLTSRLVPRSVSVLGNVGCAALLRGVVCDLLGIADLAPASGAGIAFLVPGVLTGARLVPASVGGAG